MTNSKSSLYRAPQDHLTTNQLYQYLEGELSATDTNQVEQHLLDCDLCSEALEGLSLISRHQAETAIFEINHHIKNRSARRKENPILKHLKNWGITTVILFMLIFSAAAVWYLARQASVKPNHPTQILNEPATPIIGLKAYHEYLTNNLRYPALALEKQVSGTVMLHFQINPDGTLSRINVKKSLGYGCDEEAVRLLREGPKWKPASQNQQNITSTQYINIPFRLP